MSKLVTWIWTPPEGYTGEQVNAYCAVSYGMVLGLFGHILFLFLFWSLDLEELALLNIGSVALFLIGAILLAKRQMVLTSLAIGSIEVLVHGWIATVKLGWEASFHYHILAVLALWFLITGLPWVTRLAIAARGGLHNPPNLCRVWANAKRSRRGDLASGLNDEPRHLLPGYLWRLRLLRLVFGAGTPRP